MSGDLDPAVARAFRRLTDASDRLATARIRTDRMQYPRLNDPVEVDHDLMLRLAGREDASDALKSYAERVLAGECSWHEIESRAVPVPPEVAELKADPYFIWTWHNTPPAPTPVDDEEPEGPPTSWLV